MIKKSIILILLLVTASLSIRAESDNTQQYITNDNIEKYLKIAAELERSDPDSAEIISLQIINFTENKKHINSAYNVLGEVYYQRGRHKDAVKYLKKCLVFSQETGNKKESARLLNAIGAIYYSWGINEKALEYMFMSIDIYKSLNDSSEFALLYNNIGLLYKNIEKPQLSINFYKKALKIAKFNNDTNYVPLIYNNTGGAYLLLQQFDSAEYYFLKSIALKKITNNELSLAHSFGNLSDLYIQKTEYKKAIEHLKKVLFISERIDNINIKTLANSSMGKVYTKLGVYSMAEDYLKNAMRLSNKMQSHTVKLDIVKNFADLYFEIKDYKKATQYLRQYIAIKDSMFSQEKLKKISELQVVYNMESNQLENESLKKINLSHEQKIKEVRHTTHYIVVISILIILIIVLFNRFQLIKKKNKINKLQMQEIEALNKKLKDHNKQSTLTLESKMSVLKDNINLITKQQKEQTILLKKEQKSNNLKDDFLNNISQEIRIPLNTISGLSSLLKMKNENENEEIVSYLDGIAQNSDRLLTLLNNVIDYNRIESENIRISAEHFKLHEIINGIVQLYKFRINEKKLNLIIDVSLDIEIKADKVYLSKVLNELIDNAVRYTKQGDVKVLTDQYNEKEVCIKICDTGSGISSKNLPHIFKSVETPNNATRFKNESAGLPLSKRLIEMLGGRIEISSKEDEGTTVTIILPIYKQKGTNIDSDTEITISDEVFKQKEFQIFLIEDDYFNKLMIESVLDKIGIVTATSNGEEALKVIEEKHNNGDEFDIMIVDINLPDGWDGISLMQTIRERWPLYNDIIFIANTAYADNTDKKRFIESGFNEYITKPIDSTKLTNLIKYRLMN